MHYLATIDLAFSSVEYIMREVNFGWFLRYLHSNGASMFFVVVFLHIARGLFYSSFCYPRELLWVVGVSIFSLMIVIAFLGYVLPWGQMSFWGATVITNLLSAIPFWGEDIVVWLWGSYSVDGATLNRFYSLHFFLPFVLVLLVLVHLELLHLHRSGNPLGVKSDEDNLWMFPYFILKDLVGILCFFFLFFFLVFFSPDFLGHSDNYISANPLVTPSHIVPEWYFLPFFAILRSIPDKLFGVLALFLSISTLAFLPYIVFPGQRSLEGRVFLKVFFFFLLGVCLMLGWLGGKTTVFPFLELSQLFTFSYFFMLWEILPFLHKEEFEFFEKIVEEKTSEVFF
jgi:ubiquinol-cytochrome c reductase cytochrome b subunit